MILNFFIHLKLCFGLTLLLAAIIGDIVHVWHENNMAEEFLIITVLFFTYLAVTKLTQLRKSME